MDHVDYIVAAVPFLLLIISVIAGRVRGFAEIVISSALVILCMFFARKYASPAAEALNETFIHGRLVDYLSSVIGKNAGSGGESVMNSLPAYLREILTGSGVTAASLASSAGPQSISERIAPLLEEGLILPALTSALFAFVFIFARIAGRIVASLTGAAVKLPVIKQVNGLLGAALGGIIGIILAALSVLIMFAAAGFLPETEFAAAVNNSETLNSLNELISSII